MNSTQTRNQDYCKWVSVVYAFVFLLVSFRYSSENTQERVVILLLILMGYKTTLLVSRNRAKKAEEIRKTHKLKEVE
jgi:Mn2+/Fe2+ NRAMP family transporter